MIADQSVNKAVATRSLVEELKANTTTIHDGLDKTIMSMRPFSSIARYALFLEVQYRFHLAIAPLYNNAHLIDLFNDLPQRARVSDLESDLRDVKKDLSDIKNTMTPIAVDYPASLGWLYVSEGSNLGAEYLLKAAKRIGLSEQFGALHLAPATQGRAQSWQAFTSTLNAVDLTKEQQRLAIAGARDAFAFVRHTVDNVF